jgi:hypothetical protein
VQFRADYRLTEIGLSHSFVEPVRWIRSIVVTLGYRAQRIGTRNYVLGFTRAGGSARQPNTRGELVDLTTGFIVGLQGAF